MPVNDRECRRIAIRKMGEIYSQAKKVLIFDPACILIRLRGFDEELTMGLMATRWSQRLWRLQEAQFASRLELLFNNCGMSPPSPDYHFGPSKQGKAVRFDGKSIIHSSSLNFPNILLMALLETWLKAQNEWLQNEISCGTPLARMHHYENLNERRLLRRLITYQKNKPEIGELYKNSFESAPFHEIGYFQSESNRWKLFWRLLNALRYRKASCSDDETICVASILGLDVGPLFSMSHKERMKNIALYVGKVPKSLLYFTGERFKDDGIRWLPTSYLLQENVNHYRSMVATEISLNDNDRLARVERDGLRFSSDGWIFEPNRSKHGQGLKSDHLYVRNGKGER